MTDPPPAPPACPPRVVWWREPAGDREVPRAHGVGWATIDGGRFGTMQIGSSHLRLQPSDIEYELSCHLAQNHIDHDTLGPAEDGDTEISSLVWLAVAGHRIARVDLASRLGLDAIGGVVAELAGRGVKGTVLVEATLSPPIASAVADWADTALTQFATAADSELRNHGWQNSSPGRWQLVARQSGTPTR